MTLKKLRIATRKSPLAMWQAEYVKNELIKHHPALAVELLGFMTEGDKLLASSLADIGGKGLFIKELEKAMLNHRADIAVHSIKDLPVEFPDGMMLAVVCEREDPRDVFVSNKYENIEALPDNAIVGTCSLRRRFQLLATRPDLKIKDLRGNVGTRLRKLDDGDYDAIILAAAGLKRVGLENRITAYLDADAWIPAAGQGAIGIECRGNDEQIMALLSPLNHAETWSCIMAERGFTNALGGSCHTPVGAYARIKDGMISLQGRLGSIDGKAVVAGEITGDIENAEQLGKALAEDVLSRGGAEVLKSL